MADASSSSFPLSNHLFAAAAIVKCILESVDAEGARSSSQGNEKKEKDKKRAVEGRRDEKGKERKEQEPQHHEHRPNHRQQQRQQQQEHQLHEQLRYHRQQQQPHEQLRYHHQQLHLQQQQQQQLQCHQRLQHTHQSVNPHQAAAVDETGAQQHAPGMQIRISRRPGRPPRKRDWRPHRPDIFIECPSSRQSLLRLAAAVLHDTTGAAAAEAAIGWKRGPDSGTDGGPGASRSSSSPQADEEATFLCCKEQAEETLSFGGNQGAGHGVAGDGGGGGGGGFGGGGGGGPTGTKRDGVPRPFASPSTLWHARKRRQWQQQPPFPVPPSLLPKSTTRVISSETYLRRLFVTASLAHVLSLDECLPRSLPSKRVISSRVAGRGDGGDGGGGGSCGVKEEVRRSREDGVGGDVRWRGNQKVAVTGDENKERDVVGGIRNAQSIASGSSGNSGGGIAADIINNNVNVNNNNSSDTRYNSFTTTSTTTTFTASPVAHDNSSTFKKYYPVTLIDSTDRRWHVTYVTTRRDNLHSGRLVDGWETFCYENELRVGDMVEFTRVEANERTLPGDRREKEPVARVFAYKKRSRH